MQRKNIYNLVSSSNDLNLSEINYYFNNFNWFSMDVNEFQFLNFCILLIGLLRFWFLA